MRSEASARLRATGLRRATYEISRPKEGLEGEKKNERKGEKEEERVRAGSGRLLRRWRRRRRRIARAAMRDVVATVRDLVAARTSRNGAR